MAVVDVTPFVMKNAIIQLGTDDFAKAVSSASITPAGGIITWKGLKPTAVFTFPESVTYTLDLEYAQDWGSTNSLSQYLFEHQGETVACTVNVNDVATGGETSWAMQVAISAGAVGGAVDNVATATVSLGIVGQPTPTFPA
jgi:hypothetical protein